MEALVVGALIVAAPAVGQRARRQMAPIPITDPAGWITPESYPLDAFRAGRSGRVVVDIGVDSGGKVVSCKVAQSSGTTSLDQRTCELVLVNGRFDPATDRKGRPIASTYSFPVRWVIPADDNAGEVIDFAEPFVRGSEIEWIMATDVIVESCRVVAAKYDGSVESCKRFPAGARWGARFTKDGEPVRAVVHERYGRTIEVAALPK